MTVVTISRAPMSNIQLILRQTTHALERQIQTEEARLEVEQQKLETDRAQMVEEHSGKRQKLETDRAHMEEVHAKASGALEEERFIFKAEKAQIIAENRKAKTKIKLDVGGTSYSTSRATLTSLPGSRDDTRSRRTKPEESLLTETVRRLSLSSSISDRQGPSPSKACQNVKLRRPSLSLSISDFRRR